MIGRFFHNYRLSIFILMLIASLLGHSYITHNYNWDFKFAPKGTDLVSIRPAPLDPVVNRPRPTPVIRKTKIETWAYYIKDPQLDKIRKADFDLIVMETGSDEIPQFSQTQINDVKATGKQAIAYLSLGAAENYRKYWKPEWASAPPEWLDPTEHKLFRGNFRVKDLMAEEWQAISFSAIDNVMNAGYSGIMINGINAPNAAEFIAKVYEYVKRRDAKFMVLVQDYVDPAIISHVDGIVKQNIMYDFGLSGKNNTNSMLEKLREFINRDKIVLGVSYTTGSKWNKVKSLLEQHSIIPYSAPVRLDVLRTDQ